jgi:RHS repeat-associated protein
VPQSTNKFVYDGWNLLAELDQTNGLIRSYVWGLDLSGSMQAAGGVGGLLALNTASNGSHFACFDGNGNVSAMVDASNNTASAQFEYGPFGESIGVFGSIAAQAHLRFSSKYSDGEPGWSYYGHRYYNPSCGRWCSRDPKEDEASPNLYALGRNNPLSEFDFLGLAIIEVTEILNADPSSFEDPDNDAETLVTFTGTALKPTRCKCGTEYTGWNMAGTATIRYKPGISPNMKIPGRTRTYGEHEHVHVHNMETYAKNIDFTANNLLVGKCWCSPCDKAVINYFKALNDLDLEEARLANAELDCSDWPSPRNQKKCQEAKQRRDNLPNLYQKADDAYYSLKFCGQKK